MVAAAAAPRVLTGGLLFVLAGLSALGTLATNIILPSLPGIGASLRVSTHELGIIIGAFFLTFGAGQLVVGPLSDRFGRRNLVMGGLVVFALGSVACAFATDLSLMIAARVVQALGACAASVLSRAIARDLFEGEALARVLSLTMVAMAAAPGLSPLLGGALNEVLGWRAAFFAVAALGVVLAFAYGGGVGETHPASRRTAVDPVSILRAYGRLSTDRRFILPALSAALLLGSLFGMFAASPAILMEGLGLSALQLGLFFAGTVLVVFAAGLSAPRLAHRWGPRQVATAGLAIAALGSAILLALAATGLASFGPYAAAIVVFLFGMGLANPLTTAITLSPFGEQAGLASALLGFLQMSAAAVTSTLVATIGGSAVMGLGLIMTLACVASLGVLALFARG